MKNARAGNRYDRDKGASVNEKALEEIDESLGEPNRPRFSILWDASP